MDTIKTRIVKIGNSRGIRIPKLLLDQVDFGNEVELELQDDRIVIRSSTSSRLGWDEQFEKMAAQEDDDLLDEAVQFSSWDMSDWEW